MGALQQLLVAGELFSPVEGITFTTDNTDHYTRASDLTSNADGKVGTLSAWVYIANDPATALRIFNNVTTGNATSFHFARGGFSGGARSLLLIGKNSSVTNILTLETNTLFSVAAGNMDTWHHIMMSWDLVNGLGHLWLNDKDDENTGVTVLTNDTIDYTQTSWFVAKSGGTLFPYATGCRIAELYFNNSEYIDLSVASNRRKFITNGLKPVSLGSDGSTPTGTAPIVYLRCANGETDPAAFATNQGTGGNFTKAGSPSISTTSPSD